MKTAGRRRQTRKTEPDVIANNQEDGQGQAANSKTATSSGQTTDDAKQRTDSPKRDTSADITAT